MDEQQQLRRRRPKAGVHRRARGRVNFCEHLRFKKIKTSWRIKKFTKNKIEKIRFLMSFALRMEGVSEPF